ncbi:hypothetical protein LTR85_012000 [Meristemomyces frigidus]|nr:hypothetical protein LTR85_012000 [Meristemomyces frigidus]
MEILESTDTRYTGGWLTPATESMVPTGFTGLPSSTHQTTFDGGAFNMGPDYGIGAFNMGPDYGTGPDCGIGANHELMHKSPASRTTPVHIGADHTMPTDGTIGNQATRQEATPGRDLRGGL